MNAAIRLVFLDFDGVLHPLNALGDAELVLPVTSMVEPYQLLRWAVDLESMLVGHDDVEVIIHSSWASFVELDEIREYLGPLGHRVIALCTERPRWEGVLGYVERLRPCSWIVLDDDRSQYPSPAPEELIVCDPSTGVTGDVVVRAVQTWLKHTSPAGKPDR